MAEADSTVSNTDKVPKKYFDFTSDFCHKIYEVAALVDGARALATEIDEGENIFVTLALDVVKDKLMALGTELDRTSHSYQSKALKA